TETALEPEPLYCLSDFPTESFRSFSFNVTAPTDIYTLSLHDALPIYLAVLDQHVRLLEVADPRVEGEHDAAPEQDAALHPAQGRSEEHTSELQSRFELVCRLLLEKKILDGKLSIGQ